jgi:signal transduction histidine kinase
VDQQEVSTRVVVDPCVVLGRFAGLLADGSPLPTALDALAVGLGVRTLIVRSAAGDLVAVGGEAVHAVPRTRTPASTDPVLELPAAGPSGATLTVLGGRPTQLPALRAAAAVLGLALVPVAATADLLEADEADRDELADALHDGPVQSLVVARYASDAAVRGGDAVVARDAVQVALVEVRRALWNLRPRGATGLLAALEQLSGQLVAAGGAPLHTHGGVDLTGPEGVLAYRLVQAVGGAAPVRVAVRPDDATVVVDVDGGVPLPSPERWVRRAQALGGDLAASAGRLRLVLPAPRTTDARTAP